MPKVSLVCHFDMDNGKEATSPEFEKYDFDFVRMIEVDKDLTTFYYSLRTFFRRNVSEEEKDLLLQNIKDREAVKKIKRRKNVTLEELFCKDFFVEGVERTGPNKYKVLWGV